MEPDFSGYATKANLKCSDGRTITPDAFKHQDQAKVPLVWQHAHNDPANVLGYATLEHRDDGVYCYAYFNSTPAGVGAKTLVEHGDVDSLSIYANQLVEKSKNVLHGMIREVSLVLAGANPGARIEFVNIQHADGDVTELEDEAIIFSSQPLEHSAPEAVVEEPPTEKEVETSTSVESDDALEHAEDKTIKDVFDTLSDEQKNVVYYMISEAQKGNSDPAKAEHTDLDVQGLFHSLNDEQKTVAFHMISAALDNAKEDTTEEADDSAAHSDNEEGTTMKHNVFEGDAATDAPTLSHADREAIFKAAKRPGMTLKQAVEDFATSGEALAHGIQSIDTLFPDAKAVMNTPELLSRRVEWVAAVMNGTRHTPFSRIKTVSANLTYEDARAKGYIKGHLKKEEFFKVLKRVTTPQTIYKKQKLDRDDILDITDFDVVAWLKAEMRLMLEEEIARAVLVGDGRTAGDDDKIDENCIRPIATDSDLYVTKLYIKGSDIAATPDKVVDSLVLNRRYYRGSGNPTLFTSETLLSQLLLVKDTTGRRVYNTIADLQAALRVSNIVTVELLDSPSSNIAAIMVNLGDYNIGADRGGDVSLFDDFDIDYNQYKYLIETRISGALVKLKSAVVLLKAGNTDTLVDPVAPAYNPTTHVLTVATTTGVTYKNKDTGSTLTTGSPITLSPNDVIDVLAVPNAGYFLASNTADEFIYTYDRGRVDVGAIV